MSDQMTPQRIAHYIEGLLAENDRLRKQVGLGKPINAKKLTVREVRELRQLHATSGLTQRDLADVYDINPATVSRIVRGQYHARVAW